MEKIGLGGGCHWCTEAIFQSLKGVTRVEQGFIAPEGNETSFSEAVIVHYHKDHIDLRDIIEIHLHTHKSTSEHSMRGKYRSAIYAFDEENRKKSLSILEDLQKDFDNKLITNVLPFSSFKPSASQFHNYYYKNPGKPFCETYISSKLKVLLEKFSSLVDPKITNTFHEPF